MGFQDSFQMRVVTEAAFIETRRSMSKDEDPLTDGEAKPADGEMSEEEIDYNVMGTFPASDPPSWTLGIRRHKKQVREFEGEKPDAYDPSHQNEPITPK